MDELELLKKVNLDCAIKGKPLTKLKDILNKIDKDWLNDYYYVITKKQINETKPKLINKIYNQLTNQSVIESFLNNIKENEYNELVRIIENNGEIQDDYIDHKDYTYLKSFGIVYTFNYQDKLHIIIPEEIMNIFKNINISDYHDKIIENTKLIDLAYSMVNLYGAGPLDLYLDYCHTYYDYDDSEKINLECIIEPERTISIKIIETLTNVYMIRDEIIDDEDKALIVKVISDIEDDLYEFDFKPISLDELLNYKELFYYEEIDSVIEFKEYLRDNDMDEEEIDLLIGAIILSFRRDYKEGILTLSEILADLNFEIDEDNYEEIMTHINNIINNIPIWGNKGGTNKEIILGNCYE